MRKKYILLKDSPELRKGAIVEEKCDNGDQSYTIITPEYIKFKDQGGTTYSRDTVMKSPEWFEEIVPLYCPANLIEKVEKFIKSLK